MTSCGRFILPLFLLALICFTGTNKVEGDDNLVVVHVNDDMVPNSEITRVNCTGLWNKLSPGQEFHFAELRRFRFVCNAIWRDKDGLWMAFEPIRDTGHKHVYSSIREDGFYFSYDQSNWKKLGAWRA